MKRANGGLDVAAIVYVSLCHGLNGAHRVGLA